MATAAWSTQQLAEYVAAVSAAENEAAAALAAVERAAEALDADAAAIVAGGEVVAQVGYPRGAAPVADLEAVQPGVADSSLDLPGVGKCAAAAATLEHPPGSTLVVARAGADGLTAEETSLLRGMARVASLTMRMHRLLDEERAAREELERLAREHAGLHRVATLVAEIASPDTIFSAVAEEVGSVIPEADLALVSRYDGDVAGEVVGGWSRIADRPLVGLRFPLGGRNLHTLVFESGQAARIDDLTDGAAATVLARELGTRCSAGAPIVVAGRLWGVIVAASRMEDGLPDGVTHRLADFTELVATAIAKVEAREELRALSEEQAALRRVATLVARGEPPDALFTAVAAEVGLVIPGADVALVGRYDHEDALEFVGGWSSDGAPSFVGSRVGLGGRNVSTLVFERNEPVRVDYSADDPTPATTIAREWARSSAGAPINVEGRLWGVMIVGSLHPDRLPAGVEYRLADFTDLVATAVANAQSRADLEASRAESRRTAEEQAALRRVATLVAKAAPSEAVFTAVAEEIARLLPAEIAVIGRYGNGSVTFLGGASDTVSFVIGTTNVLGGRNVSTIVHETGQSARLDRYADASGQGVGEAGTLGITSSVGVPITVAGQLWGVVVAGATYGNSIPPDTEQRLAGFTELVATAIANTQAREELRAVADEQAALKRVATLVALGAPGDQIFDAVTDEVHLLLQADETGLSRYDPDGLWTVLAVRGAMTDAIPVGFRLDPGASMPGVAELLRGRSVRVDAAPVATAVDDLIRAEHLQAWVASPIVLMGQTWGQIAVFSRHGPLPAGAEERLANFTDLVATAIANAQAREDVRAIADEQAALRRVATLVAGATPPTELFQAVTEEVGRLLSADVTGLVRYDADDMATLVAAHSLSGTTLPAGEPGRLRGRTVTALVRETGCPVRLDDYAGEADTQGSLPTFGVRSAVGAPITVEGRLWGAISVGSLGDEPPPPDTEARLAGFTELVATAIANAQTRGELEASRAESQRAAAEQAALRRVATLVASATPPTELFAAVAEEVGRLLQADRAFVSRYEMDDAVTIVASWTASGETLPVDVRFPIQEYSLSNFVRKTGQAVRIDSYPGGRASPVGNRAAVAAPITVEGRLWGLMSVGSMSGEPSPPGTEDRLASFTELVATAIANVQAREELRLVAEEQAALRRVATLVAQGASPTAIFEAVAEELGRLVQSDRAFVGRYEIDNTVTVVSVWSPAAETMSVGARGPIREHTVSNQVRKTGRAARVDVYPDGEEGIAGALGYRSSVGAPITVSGALWGLMVVGSGGDEPPPPGTEERLTKFTELVATAIANAEAQAALTASRARVVATADETRRRIERDLHDGAQQRLVTLALRLRAAQAAVPRDHEGLAAELDDVAKGLSGALDELREFARGIHPAILAEGGLRPAVKALCRRSPVPVELTMRMEGRLPERIEAGAYYIVSEALTNVAKHADASTVALDVEADAGALRISVRDNGVGGADFARGSGLVGIKDRAEALGGRISLESPAGAGTAIEVELPLHGETGGSAE